MNKAIKTNLKNYLEEEFFNIDEKKFICCSSFEEAEFLCSIFAEMQKRWANGQSYSCLKWDRNSPVLYYSNWGTYALSAYTSFEIIYLTNLLKEIKEELLINAFN